MDNPLGKVEAALSQQIHQANHKIHNQFQAILYQDMTNEHLEQALTEMSEKILVNLWRRYWGLLALIEFVLLGTQVLALKLLLANPRCPLPTTMGQSGFADSPKGHGLGPTSARGQSLADGQSGLE